MKKGCLTHWSWTVERVLPSVGIVMIRHGIVMIHDSSCRPEGLWKLPMQHYAQMRTKIAKHRCLLDKEIHRSPTQLHDDLQKRSVNHNFKIDLQFSHVLSNVLQCSKRYVRCDWSVTIKPNSTRHNSRFCTSIGCASLVSPVLNSAVTMQFYSWSPR